MSEPREPVTEAGRRLLAWDNDDDDADERMRELLGGKRHWSMSDVIPAIEAEAASAAVEARDRELRVAVERLPIHSISGYEWECYGTGCHYHWRPSDRCREYGHLVTVEGSFDADGIQCEHDDLLDRNRVLRLLDAG